MDHGSTETATRSALVRFVDDMPDLVKLTVVGLALDPPTIDIRSALPQFRAALDHFVDLGVALVAVDGDKRSYRLTQYGVEVYEEVCRRTPSDASLPANDLDYPDPDAAA